MIEAAAVVSPTGAPIYLATFGAAEDEALKLHTLLHCALDAVDERTGPGAPARPAGEAADPYLGLLHTSDALRVYGFTSMSRVKFLVAVNDPAGRPEVASELKAIFKRLQAAYIDAVSNPFYSAGAPLASPRFDASVRTIVQSLGALS